MKILQSKITGTQTSFSTNFDGKLSFILYFLSVSTAATYIFTAPHVQTTTIKLLSNLVHEMLEPSTIHTEI
jgi:hypothetical protein